MIPATSWSIGLYAVRGHAGSSAFGGGLLPADDPLAVERIEAGADDDGGADDHGQVGNIAENDEAEQDRPEQGGVAEGRDEGDVARAHRHDDELIADEHQHRRERQK